MSETGDGKKPPTGESASASASETKTKRSLEEILELIADEEEHQAAVAAVEAMSPEERRAQYEARPRRNVVALAPRRRSVVPWTLVIAAAAVALLAIGYAWKTRPRPDDEMANVPHAPQGPPGAAPPPATGLDPREKPANDEPTDDLVATPPPGGPCKPLAAGTMKLEGTLHRAGERFVFVPEMPVCMGDGATEDSFTLEPSSAKVDLASFGIARIRIEGRVAGRDGGCLVVRVDRATAL